MKPISSDGPASALNIGKRITRNLHETNAPPRFERRCRFCRGGGSPFCFVTKSPPPPVILPSRRRASARHPSAHCVTQYEERVCVCRVRQ
jgi:hypothetical protein